MPSRPNPTQTFHRSRRPDDDFSTMASSPPPEAPAFVPLRMRSETGSEIVEIDQVRAVVGRHSEADVKLAAADISRRHCQFDFEEGVWLVRDLSSLNGVFVNGERVRVAPLHLGDRVSLGMTTFIIERAAPAKTSKVSTLRSIAKVFAEG